MFRALTSFLVPIASILLGVFSIVLTHLLNSRSSNTDTIQTWTCKFSKALPSIPMTISGSGVGGTSGEMSNDKFGMLCSESKFGFWGMVVVVVLQVLMGGCAVGEWIGKRRGGSGRDGEKGMEMGVLEIERKGEFSF